MLPDRVSNPGPLTYESGALPIALRGPALLIMFKIFYVHFYRPMAIFVVCYTSLVVSVTIFTHWHKMLKKVLFCFPGTNPARCIN